MLLSKKLTIEERVQRSRITIVNSTKFPEFKAMAGLIMMGDTEYVDGDHQVKTAATNGRDEIYNRDFVGTINDAQLRGVVLHENFHIQYRHLTTWEHLWKIDPQLANMAADYVINLQIFTPEYEQAGFVEKIDGMLYDEQYVNMDVQQVFNKLRQDKQSEGGSSAPPDGDSFDTHDWEGAQEMTDDERKQLDHEVDQAMRQGSMMAGKTGSGGARDLFGDLLSPQVNWRDVLRDFITDTCSGNDYCTYAKPDRRFLQYDMYMPSGVSDQVEELVIAIDTSGSIGGAEITNMLSEVRGICETVPPKRVRILYWDTEVCRDEVYELSQLSELVQSTKPAGGGGTEVACVPKWLTANNVSPQACIVLTDGYLWGGWGEWSCPVLWCILDNQEATADCGKTLHIKSGDMI
jgi:predicted metal-dependent peptidase